MNAVELAFRHLCRLWRGYEAIDDLIGAPLCPEAGVGGSGGRVPAFVPVRGTIAHIPRPAASDHQHGNGE
jgi:hypothetical protein